MKYSVIKVGNEFKYDKTKNIKKNSNIYFETDSFVEASNFAEIETRKIRFADATEVRYKGVVVGTIKDNAVNLNKDSDEANQVRAILKGTPIGISSRSYGTEKDGVITAEDPLDWDIIIPEPFELIIKNGWPKTVRRIKVKDLDLNKCSFKFRTAVDNGDIKKDLEVFIKYNSDYKLDLRGKKQQYRMYAVSKYKQLKK